MKNPRLGNSVLYRSHLGTYSVPAVVVATAESIEGSGGAIDPVDDESHVHLQVFTPTEREGAEDPDHPRAENVGGTYLRINVAHDPAKAPGTWHWQDESA